MSLSCSRCCSVAGWTPAFIVSTTPVYSAARIGVVDRIQLKGMTFSGRHGVSDAERERTQDFVVTVEVQADLARPGRSDRIEDTLDYRLIRKVAKDVVEGPSV